MVASVAMNGGSRRPLIMKACNRPIARPKSNVIPIANATSATEGGAAAGAALAQPFGQELGADDRRQRDDRTGREVDSSADDHDARADRKHAEEGDPVQQCLEAVRLEESVVPVQHVDHAPSRPRCLPPAPTPAP